MQQDPDEPKPESTLGQRALSGALYYSAIPWVMRAAGTLSALLLARLLEPADFGLVALAMIVISLLQGLSEPGLLAAALQRPDCDREDYDVAWTYGRALRGFVLFGCLLAIAPAVARFYNELELGAILRVLAIEQLLSGAMNIGGAVLLQKELQFRRDNILALSGHLARLVVVIPLAFWWRNAWALVVGTLASSATRLLMSYRLHPFRPRLNLDLQRARALMRFGGWMIGVNLASLVQNGSDRAILGRVMGVTNLGFYEMGVRWGGEVPSLVSGISKVLFPVFSLMQKDARRMGASFRQVLSATLFLAVPACVGLALSADYFVVLVLGSKWQLAITPMRALSLAGVFHITVRLATQLFQGAGAPQFTFVVHLVGMIATIAMVLPLARAYGSDGAALGALIGAAAPLPLVWTYTRRVSGLKGRELLASVAYPLLAGTFMAGGVLVVRLWTHGAISWSAFAASILMGMAIYSSCVWYAWRFLRVDSLDRLIVQLRPYVRRLARFSPKRA